MSNLVKGMFIIVLSIVSAFIFIGYNIITMLQPFELLLICGSAVGLFTVSSTRASRLHITKTARYILSNRSITKKDYIALLSVLHKFLRLLKSKDHITVEKHIEHPYKSKIFKELVGIPNHETLVDFICDYTRIVLMGCEDPYELENMMLENIETLNKDVQEHTASIQRVADALPAIGIIGAILGIVSAMQSLGQKPDIIAVRIGSALMSTFIGITISYCIITPICFEMHKHATDNIKMIEAIKHAMLLHLRGNTPFVAVELTRKTLSSEFQPNFTELENAVSTHVVK